MFTSLYFSVYYMFISLYVRVYYMSTSLYVRVYVYKFICQCILENNVGLNSQDFIVHGACNICICIQY